MPLKLSNLDDRRYSDLVEEARSLIPTYAPEWTNHNPSDPGITLVELFAHLTEMMIYRLNRVTDEDRKRFLKLLNGPDWIPGDDLRDETRRAVLRTREVYRAVTCQDYEELATVHFNQWLSLMQQVEHEEKPLDDWWRVTQLNPKAETNLPSQVKRVVRARCVPQKNLDAGNELERSQTKPGHLSVIIVPNANTQTPSEQQLLPNAVQRQAVWGYLDERRTLTTRHHVVGPLYAPVSVEAILVRRVDVPTNMVLQLVVRALTDFLYPIPDGEGRRGWQFGRDVYVSEVTQALEAVNGVDHVPDIMLLSRCASMDSSCVAAESVWHDEGDLVGLRVPEPQLPLARIDEDSIVIVPSTSVLIVIVTISAVASSTADKKLVKRIIKQTVRRFFHPLYDGPRADATSDTTLAAVDLKTAMNSIPDLQQVNFVKMEADPSRCKYDQGQVSAIVVKAGEVVDVRLHLDL